MDELDIAEPEVADTPCADAAETVTDFEDGFHLRFIPGPCGCLNWQAGIVVTEFRSYRDPSMAYPMHANVTLFRLLGVGYSKEAAIGMAKLNPNWRNGR